MIIIHKEVGINLSPKEIAQLFCSMDNQEMADFFNEVAREVEKWEHPFPFQMENVTQTKSLSTAAREVMKIIGDYSEAMPAEPKPQLQEVHGWTRDMVAEVIKRINGLCGPDEVMHDLAKSEGPITEDIVIIAIRNNEPF